MPDRCPDRRFPYLRVPGAEIHSQKLLSFGYIAKGSVCAFSVFSFAISDRPFRKQAPFLIKGLTARKLVMQRVGRFERNEKKCLNGIRSLGSSW